MKSSCEERDWDNGWDLGGNSPSVVKSSVVKSRRRNSGLKQGHNVPLDWSRHQYPKEKRPAERHLFSLGLVHT